MKFEKGYGQDILCNIFTDEKYIINIKIENSFKISIYSATFSENSIYEFVKNKKKGKINSRYKIKAPS